MTSSFSYTDTLTFTRTHAKHMAAKVATDLKRMQRFYGRPTDRQIADYEAEAIEFLKEGYLGTVMYGFRRNGNWIEPTLRYTARDLAGASVNDDDPGRVRPGAHVAGASFYSYLTYSSSWERLSALEKEVFRCRLPFRRNGAPQLGIDGYLHPDLVYSAGGRALERATVRSWR